MSGWEIVNISFIELGGGVFGSVWYIDIWDDWVNFYFELGGKKFKIFMVKLNVFYLGIYYLFGV